MKYDTIFCVLQYRTMTTPTVSVTVKAFKRLLNHDCWVFRDELARPDPPVDDGAVVLVTDRQGHPAGQAFYSQHSHVALRFLTRDAEAPIDRAFFRHRLEHAIARRSGLRGTNARRVVFSEADGLPGLIVDQYAGVLVVQLRNAGIDRFRPVLAELLQELLSPAGILERSDKEFREDEGLPLVTQILAGAVPDRVTIEEDGLRFLVDPHHGLKTGYYLDQRPTRQRLRQWVQPDQLLLDVFSYTGSLGICAASRGARVICVEQEERVFELAKENARMNGVADRIEFIPADAFYWLALKQSQGLRADWLILDPPGLAKTRGRLQQARQALHHLLVQGLGLLNDHGRLILSICTPALLPVAEEIVRIAAADQGSRLLVRDLWTQPEDHPWVLQIPPTRYLTSWCFERDAPPAA